MVLWLSVLLKLNLHDFRFTKSLLWKNFHAHAQGEIIFIVKFDFFFSVCAKWIDYIFKNNCWAKFHIECMCNTVYVSTLYVQHVILLRVLFPFSSWICFRLHFIIVSGIYICFFLKMKYGKIFGLMNRLSRHIKKANKVEWKMQPCSHRHMHPNK